MAVDFLKKEKRQKILVIASIIIMAVIIVIIWQRFFAQKSYFPEEIYLPAKEIKINFEILEQAKKFQLFAEIEPFVEVIPGEEDEEAAEMRIGRITPFLSY